MFPLHLSDGWTEMIKFRLLSIVTDELIHFHFQQVWPTYLYLPREESPQ